MSSANANVSTRAQISAKAKKHAKLAPKKKAAHGNKASANIMKEVEADQILSDLTGCQKGPRYMFVKLIWRYIKAHGLQKPTDGRIVIPDEGLAKLMGTQGKESNAYKMTYIFAHNFF